MGIDISDLRDRTRTLHANWWQWRPTVELIRSLGLFEEARLGHLSNGIGELTEAEAHELAAAFEKKLLPGCCSGRAQFGSSSQKGANPVWIEKVLKAA
jgi:hypothetical protein